MTLFMNNFTQTTQTLKRGAKMNINELKEIADGLNDVIYDKKEDTMDRWLLQKDRPRGMKKDDWETLVTLIDDLLFKVNRAITKKDKEFLTS
jgi:hypothetical protein